ncbi:ATP-dependent DNA helicase [Alcanivorax sp. 1008]|uniref:ATP-dependent DNA helicase n=1 Tax=Alcanivorax sp. 1008 TaxID=2816853 RepID=UPI001E36DA31|nr:ATP-dependent DNA helicase [Alcanivorax sp. 1008]
MSRVERVLCDDERFASLIPGFAPRAPQLEMAKAVEQALSDSSALVVEAETGTGKTLAYLVPALLADGPTIISTGTKSLQEQLFFRDLPVVLKALGVHRRVALLKGRANYLCPYRLQLHLEEARFQTRDTALQMQVVARWAARTASGDIAELREIPEDAPVWPWVTSTAENCLGQDCPEVTNCPVMRARQEAQEADLVVVNHHLFFANAALKGEGVTELLPAANAVIFDEAHQLPDVAATFFGSTLSSRQLQELCSDAMSEAAHSSVDVQGLSAHTSALERSAADLRIALGHDGRKETWSAVSSIAEVIKAMEALAQTLLALEEFLEPYSRSSRGMESCHRRASEQRASLQRFQSGHDDNLVFWFETFKRAFLLHATPLSVAEMFDAHRAQQRCSWIFTSATLSVAGNFSHFIERLGISDAATLRLESPFDFRRQAVLYVPEDLPTPDMPDYTSRLVDNMVPVIESARGRTFFLFTSHRALREAAELLRGQIEYPLLVQGEAGRRQLLEEFREHGNAVLLGTSSFWEGIDVRGEALSCVIIDRLPFASPGDPVAAARIERIKRERGNPFRDYQLPQAVLTLRQGAGRLIRDIHDHGVLVIADPRLIDKSYGKLFLDSLPSMTRTRKPEVVERFFRYIENRGNLETAGN